MNFLRGIVAWLDAFESGSQFRKWTAILLRTVGILALIGVVVWGVVIYVGSIYASENLDSTSELVFSIIGSLISLCLNIFLGLVLILLFWNRSKKIRELDDEISFDILQSAVVLIRLVGEVGFILFVVSGIQGLVSSIFGGGFLDILGYVLIEFEINGQFTFIGGILTFLGSTITGAIALIISYCSAALINLFMDMATKVRNIDSTISTEENSSDSIEEMISDEEHNSDS